MRRLTITGTNQSGLQWPDGVIAIRDPRSRSPLIYNNLDALRASLYPGQAVQWVD